MKKRSALQRSVFLCGAAGALSLGSENAQVSAKAARKDVANQLDPGHGSEIELAVQQCGSKINQIKDSPCAQAAEQAILFETARKAHSADKTPETNGTGGHGNGGPGRQLGFGVEPAAQKKDKKCYGKACNACDQNLSQRLGAGVLSGALA